MFFYVWEDRQHKQCICSREALFRDLENNRQRYRIWLAGVISVGKMIRFYEYVTSSSDFTFGENVRSHSQVTFTTLSELS